VYLWSVNVCVWGCVCVGECVWSCGLLQGYWLLGWDPPPSQNHRGREKSSNTHTQTEDRSVHSLSSAAFSHFLALFLQMSATLSSTAPSHRRKQLKDVCTLMLRECRRASATGCGRRRRRRSLELRELNSYASHPTNEKLSCGWPKTAGPSRGSLPNSSFKALAEVCWANSFYSGDVDDPFSF